MNTVIADLIRQEFPLNPDIIYLNHAAVSPWPKRTAEAVQAFAEDNIHFGATHYGLWIEKERQLRKQLKSLINAPSYQDIALLKNTSEALSVIAEGIEWQPGDNIITSDQEFPSNRIPWQAQEYKNTTLRQVNLFNSDTPEQALLDACDNKTRLLTISSVQYASGLKLDLKQIGNFCFDNDIIFCVDAIQSIGAHSIDVQACHIDCLMADAHKWMMGPEGIAVFYCNEKLRNQLTLHQFGWHMVEDLGHYDNKEWIPAWSARRFECGSPNMLGIHALSASLSLIEQIGQNIITEMIDQKIEQLIQALLAMNLNLISTCEQSRRSGIVNFIPAGHDPDYFYQLLMQKKLICANRGGGIRLSPHFYTTDECINTSLDIISSTL